MVVVVSGFATIVEASAIAAAYALFVELAIFRDLKPFGKLPRVLLDAGGEPGLEVEYFGLDDLGGEVLHRDRFPSGTILWHGAPPAEAGTAAASFPASGSFIPRV